MKPTRQPTTSSDIDPVITPAALLRAAAVYLQHHGWTQHQFYDLIADTTGPFPPACASGAIMTAATGRCLASGICTLDGDEDPDTITAIRALRVFAAWLDLEYTPVGYYETSAIDVIGDWNDYAGRTFDEVIETLTDAADDWDRTHLTGGAR
ncbi:DUF6197 family protein [Actinoplanes siamensis]|uniref:Uncharacterized protein n=1 Tax=Actinoplanes siamensis TaxID=1223317 RepID=A0A919N5D3_9ACTN|nr:hypothetical protein [Actinoplanes siamensis]GIF04691.1 hypothetical protein Asi03nite_22290 [Actinoplanes siamensis]